MIQRILLVEDEEAIAIALQDRLVRAGYEVEVATDGIAAFNRALNSHFHLILLDLLLPGKSGIDVCRDLRQLGILTPILMLTAFGAGRSPPAPFLRHAFLRTSVRQSTPRSARR